MFGRVLNTPLFNLTLNEGGPYHIENNPLTCSANQRTGFYIIRTSVIKELKSTFGYILTRKHQIEKQNLNDRSYVKCECKTSKENFFKRYYLFNCIGKEWDSLTQGNE